MIVTRLRPMKGGQRPIARAVGALALAPARPWAAALVALSIAVLAGLVGPFANSEAAAAARWVRPLGSCATLGAPWVCGQVQVPLDHTSGAGSVVLSLAYRHPAGPPRNTVVGLAGGPGEPALAAASFFAGLAAPALGTRDMLVFDPRGVGQSSPVDCPRIEGERSYSSRDVAHCARQLGPIRGHYASRDTAADLEDVRALLGVPQVLPFGISYGTKDATDYARLYPSRVEAMVLDSVIAPDTDPFYRLAASSTVRVLRAECQAQRCGFDPATDLTGVVRHQRSGYVRIAGASFSEAQLLDSFIGDKAGLSHLPFWLHAAHHGDPFSLLGDLPTAVADLRSGLPERQSRTVYLATTCDDSPLPWYQGDPRSVRLAKARAAVRRLGSGFAPFTPDVGLQYGVAGLCSTWPSAGAEPTLGPLPNVPALVLSGADDVLTPLEGALQVTHGLPQAQLVVVPGATHAVLEQAPCARAVVARFVAGQSAGPC